MFSSIVMSTPLVGVYVIMCCVVTPSLAVWTCVCVCLCGGDEHLHLASNHVQLCTFFPSYAHRTHHALDNQLRCPCTTGFQDPHCESSRTHTPRVPGPTLRRFQDPSYLQCRSSHAHSLHACVMLTTFLRNTVGADERTIANAAAQSLESSIASSRVLAMDLC